MLWMLLRLPWVFKGICFGISVLPLLIKEEYMEVIFFLQLSPLINFLHCSHTTALYVSTELQIMILFWGNISNRWSIHSSVVIHYIPLSLTIVEQKINKQNDGIMNAVSSWGVVEFDCWCFSTRLITSICLADKFGIFFFFFWKYSMFVIFWLSFLKATFSSVGLEPVIYFKRNNNSGSCISLLWKKKKNKTLGCNTLLGLRPTSTWCL